MDGEREARREQKWKHETDSEHTCRRRPGGKGLLGQCQGFGLLGQRGHPFLLWGNLGNEGATDGEFQPCYLV